MTAGLPFTLLAFHRLADRPIAGRGAALGARWPRRRSAAATTASSSRLMVGFAILVVAASAPALVDRDRSGSRFVGGGGSSPSLLVPPAFLPYITLQQVGVPP